MDSKDIQQELFGFIGTGNMGGALARALRKQVPGSRILLSNRTSEKSRLLAGELNAVQSNNDAVARSARYIFLGVKPQMTETLLSEIAPVLAGRQDRFLLVTMAAGLTIAHIRRMAGGDYPVIRIMPNTPVSVGEGMILYSCSPDVEEKETQIFLESCAGAGRL